MKSLPEGTADHAEYAELERGKNFLRKHEI